MNMSTKRFIVFFRVIYFVLTYVNVSSLLLSSEHLLIYKTFYLGVAQSHMNETPKETWTHLTSKPTWVSSSLIGCLIHMALCYI